MEDAGERVLKPGYSADDQRMSKQCLDRHDVTVPNARAYDESSQHRYFEKGIGGITVCWPQASIKQRSLSLVDQTPVGDSVDSLGVAHSAKRPPAHPQLAAGFEFEGEKSELPARASCMGVWQIAQDGPRGWFFALSSNSPDTALSLGLPWFFASRRSRPAGDSQNKSHSQ